MKRGKKALIAVFLFLFILLISGYGLLQLSKSRTFQLFGEIIPRIDTERKVVALTFDDGPTKYTKEVLKELKEKNVKATFFVMGEDLKKNLHYGKEIVSSGHELGNHTYTHQRMWFKSPSFISEEIESTNQLIRASGYKGPIYFRPPYGKKLITLPWYLDQHHIKTITWDIEPDTYGNSVEFLTKYTLDNAQPGSIILLHPFCEPCSGQREAIGKIIEGLENKGYKFVTISELLTYEKQ